MFFILGCSLVVNVLLLSAAAYWVYWRGGFRRIIRANVTAIWNTKIWNKRRRKLFQAFDHARYDHPVVMFGDSLTVNGLWTEWFGQHVLNRGIGGENTSDALERITDIAALQPIKVFIFFGVNDYGVIHPAQTVRNIGNIVSQLQATSTVPEIYVISLLPAPYRTREEWVTSINNALRQQTEQQQAHWLDLHPLFADGPVMDRKLSWDGVHLSPEGYKLLRNAIAPLITQSIVS